MRWPIITRILLLMRFLSTAFAKTLFPTTIAGLSFAAPFPFFTIIAGIQLEDI